VISQLNKAAAMLGIDKPRIVKRRGSGADDETTGRVLKAMAKKIRLAGRGGDHRGMRPDDAPDAGGVSEIRL